MSVSDASSLDTTNLQSHGSHLSESQALGIGLGVGGALLLVVLVCAGIYLRTRRSTTKSPRGTKYAHVRGPSVEEKNTKETASSSKSLREYNEIIRNSISNNFTYLKWKAKLERKKPADIESGKNVDTAYRVSMKSEKSALTQKSHLSGDITDETRLFKPITMDFSSPSITLTLPTEPKAAIDDYNFPMPPLPRKSSRRDSIEIPKPLLSLRSKLSQRTKSETSRSKSQSKSGNVSRQSSIGARSFAYLSSHITSTSPTVKLPSPIAKYSPVDQGFENAPPAVPRKSSKRMSALIETASLTAVDTSYPMYNSYPPSKKSKNNETRKLESQEQAKSSENLDVPEPLKSTKKHRKTASNASSEFPSEEDYALAAEMSAMPTFDFTPSAPFTRDMTATNQFNGGYARNTNGNAAGDIGDASSHRCSIEVINLHEKQNGNDEKKTENESEIHESRMPDEEARLLKLAEEVMN